MILDNVRVLYVMALQDSHLISRCSKIAVFAVESCCVWVMSNQLGSKIALMTKIIIVLIVDF